MANSYLFMQPAKLPLSTEELSEETVRPFEDVNAVRTQLEQHLPGLTWEDPDHGQAEVDGRWVEVSLHQDGDGVFLSLRCSLRADYRDLVQDLCDSLGWVAFDQTPMCYQPRRAPIPA
jgi:hypothetical protein